MNAPKTASEAMLCVAAAMLDAARAGRSIPPETAAHYAQMVAAAAHGVTEMEDAMREASQATAARLEAIEAGSARGVVVRMRRAHSDHVHGDGGAA
jgi:hypothetical protein